MCTRFVYTLNSNDVERLLNISKFGSAFINNRENNLWNFVHLIDYEINYKNSNK